MSVCNESRQPVTTQDIAAKIQCADCYNWYQSNCVQIKAADNSQNQSWRCTNCSKQQRQSLQKDDQLSKLTTPSIIDLYQLILSIKDELIQLKKSNDNNEKELGKSLDLAHEKLDENAKAIKGQSENINVWLSKIDALKEENLILRKQLNEANLERDKLNQYGRHNTVEIYGVPESANEDVYEVLKGVGRSLDMPINSNMIDIYHSLKKPPHQTSGGIIVKFVQGADKELIIPERKKEDTSNTSTVPTATVKVEDIYVEDHVIECPEKISLDDMFGEKSSPSEVAAPACHQFEQPHPLPNGLLELNTDNILEPEENEPDPRNICHICGRELSDAWNLKRHYLVHSQDRPHKCELCGRGFNQSTHLKAHILTHSERQSLQCGDCGKVFSVSRNLRRHILTHSPTKPHICPVCNKGFVQASDLKAHLLTHSGGVLPHVCTVCGKGFARPYQLRTHATIHTGEKPHICKVCGKRFRDSGFLRKHSRTHASNKKPQHACTICGKTFSQSSHLKKHSLVHTRAD